MNRPICAASPDPTIIGEMRAPQRHARGRRRVRAPALGLAAALGLLAAPPLARAEPPTPRCEAEACASLPVSVRVAGDRVPLPNATVLVQPAPPHAEPGPWPPRGALPPEPSEPAWARTQRSDAQGHVSFEGLPAGRVHVIVIVAGYERHEQIVDLAPGPAPALRLFVPPVEGSPFRTTVNAQPIARGQVTEHVLTKQEIATLPGSQGDPLRALQNLPGVARPPGGLGLLVIRGAAPSQSQVFMGGHAMPRAFHFLSLASVFPADVLDQLHYVPSNFDAAYGNATGGIVVIEPRQGRRDGVHGFGELDLSAASAMMEGPLGQGSFIVGAQRAYVDGVLATGAAVTERVTDEPASLLLPRYYDYQALFDHPLPGGAWVSVRAFGSGDVLRARSSPLAASVSSFRLRSDFHRLDLVFRKQRTDWTVRLTPSFRFQSDRLVAAADTFRRRRRDLVGSARAELVRRLGPRAFMTVGTDFELDGYFALDQQAELGVPGDAPFREDRDQGLQSALGLYATAELALGRLTLRPGARFSAFSVGDRLAYAADPRAVARVDLADRWQLDLGLGRYSQVRSIADRNEVDLVDQSTGIQGASLFLPSAFGNLDPAVSFAPQQSQLNVREALHASASLRYQITDVGSAELTGFVRNQHNNVPPLDDGARNPFDSDSQAAGLEALVRTRLGERLYGWVGYTLTYAQLVLRQTPPGFPYTRRASDYDQRHNLVVLLSHALPKRVRIGARFRLVSGLPYSPVVGSVALPGGYQPIFGARNSARLPMSHQLDLRIDKRWVRDRVTVTAYVDVQNVYNRVNPELVLYAADFRSEAGYVGLPIFPSLGVRLDF